MQLLEENPELVFWRQLGDGVSPLQLAAGMLGGGHTLRGIANTTIMITISSSSITPNITTVYGPLESVDAIVRTAQKMAATSKTARKSHSVFASVLNHKNAIGQTPLMLACKSRYCRC